MTRPSVQPISFKDRFCFLMKKVSTEWNASLRQTLGATWTETTRNAWKDKLARTNRREALRLSDSCWCYFLFTARTQSERLTTGWNEKTLDDRSPHKQICGRHRSTKTRTHSQETDGWRASSRQPNVSLLVPTFLPPHRLKSFFWHNCPSNFRFPPTDAKSPICSSIWLIWDCRRTFGVKLCRKIEWGNIKKDGMKSTARSQWIDLQWFSI